MGQARQRGELAQRIAQAQAKVAATRPERLLCNGCGADVTTIHPVSTRGLAGIEAIWVGQCDCGQTTFAASGDPKAVVLTHDAVDASARATSRRLAVDPASDRWLACLPLAESAGQATLGYHLGCHPGESGILSAAGR